jgi:hypothetical protein
MTFDPAVLLERIRLKRDYQETFGTPHGERVLKHLLSISGATRPKFTTDADQLRWNEAQRHFALSIFRQVHASMDTLPDYITEELKRSENQQNI